MHPCIHWCRAHRLLLGATTLHEVHFQLLPFVKNGSNQKFTKREKPKTGWVPSSCGNLNTTVTAAPPKKKNYYSKSISGKL